MKIPKNFLLKVFSLQPSDRNMKRNLHHFWHWFNAPTSFDILVMWSCNNQLSDLMMWILSPILWSIITHYFLLEICSTGWRCNGQLSDLTMSAHSPVLSGNLPTESQIPFHIPRFTPCWTFAVKTNRSTPRQENNWCQCLILSGLTPRLTSGLGKQEIWAS